MHLRLVPVLCLVLSGCAFHALRGDDLDRVQHPAFISRIEEGAGPKASVFRDDSSYDAKLKRLSEKEGDRRLQTKIAKAMTRFEISERLRATTFAKLGQTTPWTQVIDPAEVAKALQSFLVEEVPANPPDYNLVGQLGADAIVEFVIEDYGIRSSGGKAGCYLYGYGRMFKLDGTELWHRSFKVDQLDAKLPGLDPFVVAKEPEQYRNAMALLLDAVAEQFSKDLNPPDRSPPTTTQGGQDVKEKEKDEGPQPMNKGGDEGGQKPAEQQPQADDPI